jgi:hypothetical protein
MSNDSQEKLPPDMIIQPQPQLTILPAETPLDEGDTIPLEQPAQGTQVIAVTQSGNAPWTLQQFFNGEIDLERELVARFPNVPLMSTIRFRSLGAKSRRGIATLATQDGTASTLVEADAATRVVQFSFSFGSMLTLRFRLSSLSDADRSRWLELMRREQGGLAFLWGQSRWESDYVICIVRKHFTNLYAFSNREFDAAVRLTPDVTRQMLDWLESMWKADEPGDGTPKLLTW